MLRIALFAMLSLPVAGRADTCRAHADELGTYLTTMDHDMTFVDTSGAHLAVRDDAAAAPFEDAPILRIDTAFALQGRPLRGPELAQALKDARAKLPDGRASRVFVVVDEAARWDAIVTATRAAAANGFVTAELVFARTPKVAPPPASPIDADLAKIRSGADASDGATKLAALARKVVAGCPSLVKAFGAVAPMDTMSRAEALLRSIGPAVAACNCNVDIPSLRTLMWTVAGNERPISVLEVRLDDKAPHVDLPAATPWRDANKRFDAKTRAAWPGVK